MIYLAHTLLITFFIVIIVSISLFFVFRRPSRTASSVSVRVVSPATVRETNSMVSQIPLARTFFRHSRTPSRDASAARSTITWWPSTIDAGECGSLIICVRSGSGIELTNAQDDIAVRFSPADGSAPSGRILYEVTPPGRPPTSLPTTLLPDAATDTTHVVRFVLTTVQLWRVHVEINGVEVRSGRPVEVQVLPGPPAAATSTLAAGEVMQQQTGEAQPLEYTVVLRARDLYGNTVVGGRRAGAVTASAAEVGQEHAVHSPQVSAQHTQVGDLRLCPGDTKVHFSAGAGAGAGVGAGVGGDGGSGGGFGITYQDIDDHTIIIVTPPPDVREALYFTVAVSVNGEVVENPVLFLALPPSEFQAVSSALRSRRRMASFVARAPSAAATHAVGVSVSSTALRVVAVSSSPLQRVVKFIIRRWLHRPARATGPARMVFPMSDVSVARVPLEPTEAAVARSCLEVSTPLLGMRARLLFTRESDTRRALALIMAFVAQAQDVARVATPALSARLKTMFDLLAPITPTVPFNITVDRAALLADTVEQLEGPGAVSPPERWRSQLSVCFTDAFSDAAVDMGGVAAEWAMLLSSALFSPSTGLFGPVGSGTRTEEPEGDFFSGVGGVLALGALGALPPPSQPLPVHRIVARLASWPGGGRGRAASTLFSPARGRTSHTEPSLETLHYAALRICGRFLGHVVLHGLQAPVTLSRAVLHALRGSEPVITDLSVDDPAYLKDHIQILLTCDVDSISPEDPLRFEDDAGNPLVPGGEDLAVTNENKHSYVQLLALQRLTMNAAPSIAALAAGFHDIVPLEAISRPALTLNELGELISGPREFSLAALRAQTVSEGSGTHHDDWLWSYLAVAPPDTQRRFLRYTTGLVALPRGGLDPHLTVRWTGGSSTLLPTSSTCLHYINIPGYTNWQEFSERLSLALAIGVEGFGMS